MTTSVPAIRGFRLLCWVTAINVLIACGFSLTGLVYPQSILPGTDAPTDASFIFAAYAAARSIPLVLAVLFSIYRKAVQALLALGVLAGMIQACDFIVGMLQGDIGKVIGPLFIAVAQFHAVVVAARGLRESKGGMPLAST